jgi:hypothetical protein
MANEITVLDGDSQREYRLLFLYPIAAPAQVGGSNIVVTPSATLPDYASSILTTQEKADLDGGTKAFEVITFRKDVGLTGPQLAAAARAKYATRRAEYLADYAVWFAHIGTRLNES